MSWWSRPPGRRWKLMIGPGGWTAPGRLYATRARDGQGVFPEPSQHSRLSPGTERVIQTRLPQWSLLELDKRLPTTKRDRRRPSCLITALVTNLGVLKEGTIGVYHQIRKRRCSPSECYPGKDGLEGSASVYFRSNNVHIPWMREAGNDVMI